MQRSSSGSGDGPVAKLRRITRACEPCRIRKDRVRDIFGHSDDSVTETSLVIIARLDRGNVSIPRLGRKGSRPVKVSNDRGIPQGYKKSLEEKLSVYELALCHLSGSLPGQVDSAIRDVVNDPRKGPSEADLREWRTSPINELLMQLSSTPRPNRPPTETTDVFTPLGLPAVAEPTRSTRSVSIQDSPEFPLLATPAPDFSSMIEADLE